MFASATIHGGTWGDGEIYERSNPVPFTYNPDPHAPRQPGPGFDADDYIEGCRVLTDERPDTKILMPFPIST